MTYELSPAAEEDFFAIYLAGVAQFGVTQAESYAAGLRKTLDLLATFPRAIRLRLELPSPIRIHRHKAHLIFFDVDDADDILIVRIRHGHEDWQSAPL